MKLPRIDIKELEKMKEDNFKDRLEFIDKYAQWVKRTENSKWSLEQKRIIDGERTK